MGSPNKILGTMRIELWEPNHVPAIKQAYYSMEKFPHYKDITIGEFSFLLVKKQILSKIIYALIVLKAYEVILKHHCEIVFANCLPGLVKLYQQGGFDMYCNKLIAYNDALSVPVAGVALDAKHYKAINSFAYPVLKKYLSQHKITQEEEKHQHEYGQIIENYNKNTHNKKIILRSIKKYLNDVAKSNVFKLLSIKELQLLSSSVLNIQEDETIFSTSMEDKEIYVVLSGQFDVVIDDIIICTLNPGDIFGEMAFFLPHGKRTATIHSLTPARLLLIRRNDIIRCIGRDPIIANKFLFVTSQILAERLEKTTQQYVNRVNKKDLVDHT